MRVMVFHIASQDVDMTAAPTPEQLEAFQAMDAFTEELVKAGVFVAAAGLKGAEDSKRIAFDDGEQTIIDGPFAEVKEMVAGFSIWEVRDMDEAMAWVARFPKMPGKGAVEIRPFFEAADLGEFISDEERAAPHREGERGRLGVA